MSQVVNAIAAIKGDKVRHKKTKLFNDVFSVREDIRTQPLELEIQYKIGVTLGAECWVTELQRMKHDDALELAVQRTKRQVIEAIFGEFRVDFRSIERSLYDSDIETARIQLHDMEKRMFEVTLDDQRTT
jgi:hypothetical protein